MVSKTNVHRQKEDVVSGQLAKPDFCEKWPLNCWWQWR